ncbi:hypothetical protein Q8F55_005095 [Vanrija albida]|uniref:BTB domain-containing protein n=1 Tax=Vanrija albida TaxID=181172 RepID=A0ABR3Q0P2_9TREE
MASTAASPASPRRFHPEYAAPVPGPDAAVLEARDGLCFRVPLSALTRSGFFKDLASLPVAEGEAERVVPLLSASSPALAFALDYFLHTDPKFPPVPSWDEAFLTDCVDVAFAYQLHVVFLALLDGLRDRPDLGPFIGFTLESLLTMCCDGSLNPPEYVNLLHDWIDELLVTPLGSMNSWCRDMLESRAPHALAALERFYARRDAVEAELERFDAAALAGPVIVLGECVHCILSDWERAHAHWVSEGVTLVQELPEDTRGFVRQTYARIECPVCRRRMNKYFVHLWAAEFPKNEWYKWPLMLGVEEGWDDDWDEFHTGDLYDDLSFLDGDMFYEDDDFAEDDDFNEDDEYADDGETIDTISYCDTDFN